MNLAIIKVLIQDLVNENQIPLYGSSEDQFEECLNTASDNGNTELVDLLIWVERNRLKDTYFRSTGHEFLDNPMYLKDEV